MNDIVMAQAVQKAVKPKFGSREVLKSKVVPHNPENIVREYIRITNAYMVLLNKTVAEYLPQLKREMTQEREGLRQDSSSRQGRISQTFRNIIGEFEKRSESFGLADRLDKLANLSQTISINQWKRTVKATLGIDIFEDYYRGEFFREALKLWTENNVALIKSIPKDTLSKMETIVSEGWAQGRSNTTIAKEIQEVYGIGKRRAQFIARDQTSKLNAQLKKTQQEDAGVEEYVWMTAKDSRVRDRHADLDGTTHRWDDPPVSDERTGAQNHPGEDYNCFPGSVEFDLANGCDKLMRRRYIGSIVNLRLSDGTLLQATPNHPCLSEHGWLPIDNLKEGDNLIQNVRNTVNVGEDDANKFIISFADCFDALERFCGSSKAASSASDFHGDGTKGNIDIVSAECLLSRYFMSPECESIREHLFPRPFTNIRNAGFRICGFPGKSFCGVSSTQGLVSVANNFFSFLDAHFAHSDCISFASCPARYATLGENPLYNVSRANERIGDRQLAFAGEIPRDYIILWQFVLHRLFPNGLVGDSVLGEIAREGVNFARDGCSDLRNSCPVVYSTSTVVEKFKTDFTGHVYNLQNKLSWYSITDKSVVVHNCRCIALPKFNLAGLSLPWEGASTE